MKNVGLYISLIIGFLVVTSCATNQELTDSESRDPRIEGRQELALSNALSLADYLARLPGVFVDDRTYPPTVSIRGGRPLFVVDGVPVGNTYASAANIVNPFDIHSVRVLKDPTDTVIYGRRAAHGVILIRTMPPRETE